MKVAISSEGNTLSSKVDSRFGRCSYFAFYDTETGKTEFVSNPAKDNTEGAGPAAVQFVASKGAGRVIAGEFGGKIKSLLESLGIAMQSETGKTIAELTTKL